MVNIDMMLERLKKAADEAGVPLGTRRMTYNSRLAQELGKWAETKGVGNEFHNAAFAAYFVDGKNIAKIPVLMDLAESVDLSREEAREILEKRTFKKDVDTDWSLAKSIGITAVPTFKIDMHIMVGAQPYSEMERFMGNAGIASRNPSLDA